MQIFNSDYMEGALPEIMDRLVETNMYKTTGYGMDEFTKEARDKVLSACGIKNEKANVYFLAGGTQTNKIVISSLLYPYEGVISAASGHISTHEAGAIENSGHKVLTISSEDGKLYAEDIKAYMREFVADDNKEHTVKPGMVYISHPTEYGGLYTKKELIELYNTCKEFELKLFMDGARLGYALAAYDTDVALEDVAAYTDVFYIGGTKCGCLFGEAVVFPKGELCKGFFSIIKQNGALLAKGRIPAIQFLTMFTDDLYVRACKNGIDMAMEIKEALISKGYSLYIDSPTNQQFVIIDNLKMQELKKNVGFSYMQAYDEKHSVIRFCTSWATKKEDVKELIKLL